ncbi:hypothetical protein D6783_03310, partial [Candidatus Woesearchaeota archaeon]
MNELSVEDVQCVSTHISVYEGEDEEALDIECVGRKAQSWKPREWYVVPPSLHVDAKRLYATGLSVESVEDMLKLLKDTTMNEWKEVNEADFFYRRVFLNNEEGELFGSRYNNLQQALELFSPDVFWSFVSTVALFHWLCEEQRWLQLDGQYVCYLFAEDLQKRLPTYVNEVLERVKAQNQELQGTRLPDPFQDPWVALLSRRAILVNMEEVYCAAELAWHCKKASWTTKKSLGSNRKKEKVVVPNYTEALGRLFPLLLVFPFMQPI